MARATKKKAELTLEEKLAQALVSEEEQPYQVPENWCWVYLGSISSNQYGYTAKAVYNQILPQMLRITDIQESGVDWINVPNCEIGEETKHKYLLQNNDIVIARTGATTGKSYMLINPVNAVFASYLIRLRVYSVTLAQYVYQFLQSDNYWKQISELSSGIAQPGVNSSKLQTLLFPVAPLPEQQRIVNRIESLFAKLDEVKEKAQAVVDGFEDRKAAILHKAFTGELTAEWRQRNGVSNNTWEQFGFDSCIEVMQNGIAKRKGDTGEPYIVLRLANLSDEGFDESDLREILLDGKEQKSYELKPDDVLMIRVNGSKDNVGKQYQITDQKHWAFCDHIIRIRYINSIMPQYMVFFSKSQVYRQYIKDNMVSSAGQNTISRKGMAKLQIPMPKKDEQAQIIAILTSLFEKERQVKETAEQIIDQIDIMKKSILARAFRGELGTNDPSDESAVELLKRVLSEK